MKLWLLYLLLLKATCTTFAGLASLPVLRSDLVINHHWLTDQQLNTAVVVTRTTPGPTGLYIVSVGYLVGRVPGAAVAWLAMISPALLVIPLLKFAGKKAQHPRTKGLLQAVVLSSAGLLVASAFPMAREAATEPFTIGLLIVCIGVLLTRKVESVWVVLCAAGIELAASSLNLAR
jgi:chromate transporter